MKSLRERLRHLPHRAAVFVPALFVPAVFVPAVFVSAVFVPAVFVLGILLAVPLAADIAVVTDKSTPVDAIDEAQARALWLGTSERVSGTKLTVADRNDSEIRDHFYSLVLRKTRGQIKAIRSKRAFQYGVAPPPEFPGDDRVLDWIRARDDRLGYVDAEAVDDSVKVLLIIQVQERSEKDE